MKYTKRRLDNTIDRFIPVNDRKEEKIILPSIHFERSILLKPIEELSCAYKRSNDAGNERLLPPVLFQQLIPKLFRTCARIELFLVVSNERYLDVSTVEYFSKVWLNNLTILKWFSRWFYRWLINVIPFFNLKFAYRKCYLYKINDWWKRLWIIRVI